MQHQCCRHKGHRGLCEYAKLRGWPTTRVAPCLTCRPLIGGFVPCTLAGDIFGRTRGVLESGDGESRFNRFRRRGRPVAGPPPGGGGVPPRRRKLAICQRPAKNREEPRRPQHRARRSMSQPHQAPNDCPSRILVALAALSPQIVTEALQGLATTACEGSVLAPFQCGLQCEN